MLLKWFRASLQRPKTTLLLAVFVTVLAILGAKNLSLRSSLADLLPDEHPAVKQARQLNEMVGGASYIVVTVNTTAQAPAIQFLQDLKQEISTWEQIRYIDDQPPDEFFRKNGLLYLSPAELISLKEKVRRKIEQEKLSKAGFFIDLGDDSKDEDWIKFESRYGAFISPNKYYHNKSATLFVSLIKPTWRATNVKETTRFLERFDQWIQANAPEKLHPDLSVQLTGPYVKQLTQQKILLRDATLVSLIALLGSIIYLIIHFRRKRAVFLIAVPLTMSVSWVLAVAWLFFGSLNLFSSVACAIVVGLAADYGIHFYTEYLHFRYQGEAAESALIKAIVYLKRPFIIASTTTAAAFLSLALSNFKAFSELGAITGFGILLCCMVFAFVLPALILLIERWKPEDISARSIGLFAGALKKPWTQWLHSRQAVLLFTFLLLAPLFAVVIGRFGFDYNMDNIMGAQETKGLDQQVDAIFQSTVNPEVAFVEQAEDAPRLAAALRTVKAKQDSLGGMGSTISHIVSLTDFVPTEQAAKREHIAEIKSLFTPQVVKALSQEGNESYQSLSPMLNPGEVSLANLPEKILGKFKDREGGLGRVLFVFPAFAMSQSDRLLNYVEEIRMAKCSDCVGPYYAAGESTVFYEIIHMIFAEGWYVMPTVLLVIFLLLWVNLRRLKEAGLAFLPLLVAVLAMIGWAALLGIPANIINLAAFPIMLGVVTDYVVHCFERYRDSQQSLHDTYVSSFRPIVGSACTTLIGFLALLFANMGGLRSLGLMSSIGIFVGMVTTLFWYPGLLAILLHRESELTAAESCDLAS